jgi:hypothetical protein
MKVIGTSLPNQQEHEVDSLWPSSFMNEKIYTRLAKIRQLSVSNFWVNK